MKNNLTIYLNVFNAKREKIYSDNVSKHNSNREKQFILLMILNKEGWHYFAVKKLSTLLRRMGSKHNGYFYYLNFLDSFVAESRRESRKIVSKNKDFCNILKASEDTQILKFGQNQ